MKTIDPLAHVRQHPEMYLPDGQHDAQRIAARIESDAITLGAGRTLNAHRDDRWIVAADIDWLADLDVPAAEAFRRPLPFPQGGRNAFRAEVLLGAFADCVATWSEHGLQTIQGD